MTAIADRPHTRPDLNQPLVLNADEFVELGEVRDRRYYVHPKYGEFVAAGHQLTDQSPMADQVYAVKGAGAARRYVPLSWLPDGSFAKAEAPAAPSRATAPGRLVDRLRRNSLVEGREGRPVVLGGTPSTRPVVTSEAAAEFVVSQPRPELRFVGGQERALGGAAIVERCRAKGVTFTDTAGPGILVHWPGGRRLGSVDELLAIPGVVRLVKSDLSGKPAACEICGKRVAVTVADRDVLACVECLE